MKPALFQTNCRPTASVGSPPTVASEAPALQLQPKCGGFSLVEVVIALFVVIVGLVAILGLFPQGLTSARNATDDAVAAMIAQDMIATRKYSGELAALGGTTSTNAWYDPKGFPVGDPLQAYFKCTLEASPVPNPNPPPANYELDTVTVTVYWPWYAEAGSRKSTPNTNIFVTEIARFQ
jgi:uncharacterized protein (TIGR02598 family)